MQDLFQILSSLIFGLIVFMLIDFISSIPYMESNKKEKISKILSESENEELKQTIKKHTNKEKSWNKIKEEVFKIYGRKCINCGTTININVHHKIPLSKGGTNDITNLIPLCKTCHEKLHKFSFNDEGYTIDEDYGKNIKKENKNKKGYIILEAIKNKQRLKIKYKKGKLGKQEITERIIQPLSLELGAESSNELIQDSSYAQDKTFLRAFCELRQEERLFRLDRILEVEEIGDIFE